jgi:hypothetical protein
VPRCKSEPQTQSVRAIVRHGGSATTTRAAMPTGEIMGSNDNQYDDGAAPIKGREEDTMRDIKEWFSDNEEQLYEYFAYEHETEFIAWLEDNDRQNTPTRTEKNYKDFAEDHVGFMRWLECEYGSRGAE